MKKTYANNKNQQQNLLIVILSFLLIFTIYLWQFGQINSLNNQINDLYYQLSNKVTRDTYLSLKSVRISVYHPKSNTIIISPLVVFGHVPGNWSFEGSFPVELKNSQNMVVAQGTAKIIGDWMTESLVPFSVELKWTTKETGSGNLIIRKDNPSGMTENDDSVSIPIAF